MTNLEKILKLTRIKNALNNKVKNEKIISFDSENELFDYINFNCPEIERKCNSIEDVIDEFETYYFEFEGKHYLVQYDDALGVAYDIAHFNNNNDGLYLDEIKYGHDICRDEFFGYMLGIYDTSIDAFVDITNQMNEIVCGKKWFVNTRIEDELKCALKNAWIYADEEEKDKFIESINELLDKDLNEFDQIIDNISSFRKYRYLEICPFFVDIPNEDSIDRIFELAKDYNQVVNVVNDTLQALIKKTEITEFDVALQLGIVKTKRNVTIINDKRVFDLVVKQLKFNCIEIVKQED